jgi:NAD(P)-dependent dehydrogenase (short-subunit alcohol dehydrogenase family)
LGDVGDPEFGQGERDGRLIILDIPNQLNDTEGSIQITNDDGEVLYSISLSDIPNVVDEDGVTSYSVLADEFDYDKGMPDGVNLTFSFNYNDTQLIFAKGIRIGDSTYRHVIPEQVEEFFKITIPDRVLVNGEDNVIYIQTTNSANRQSVPIGIGEGYFTVFVNGKKIEDLGRLIRVNGETELNVSRLESDFRKLYIYLEDLNITDNGVYNIEVMYETYAVSPTTGIYKTPLYNNNITLTSNVKANYENESIELLTGYGIDPILLYLDTYYGDINSTTGIITVSNSDNVTILEKNIKDLTYEDGRYVLRYSDFENKDFGDRITVKYGDGNERNGETSLDVLWRDMDPTDFNTTVTIDLLANTYITEEYLTKRMTKGDAIAFITSTGGFNWDREGNKKFYLPLIEAEGWDAKKSALEAMNLNRLPGTLGYMFAKSAMNYYVAYQQSRIVEQGVRLNALLPGSTDTGMKSEFSMAAGGDEKLLQSAGHAHRLAEPSEMGEPVVFLNSDMARFISGELLVVDFGAVIEEQAQLKPETLMTMEQILEMVKARAAAAQH